jgi:hypothetical protein
MLPGGDFSIGGDVFINNKILNNSPYAFVMLNLSRECGIPLSGDFSISNTHLTEDSEPSLPAGQAGSE